MGIKVANNAYGTLNAGISNVDTTLVLNSGEGSRFPTLSAGDYFYATLIDTSNNLEIVKVTARATDTMTIVRAQDGTTARAYSANDRFELRPIAALFNELVLAASAALQPSSIGVSVQAYDANLTSLANMGLFKKADPSIVAFTKTGAGTATTSSTLYIEVNGSIKTIASGTSIIMPTLSAGTDYAIWAKTDGTLEATSNHTSPPTANARKVGGFHYAPGGNAAAQAGGNTTPQINEYSFWDLKFRPACPDPRGMTLIGGGYWVDIYLTGVDAITNGSSKYNVTMADGSSPPKIPTMFGGNGSTTYGNYTWFEAMELATAFGKRCPTQQEFMSAMYGTTEASSIGTDQGSTILNAAYTSKWGVIQSTGVLWVWGIARGGPYAGASWNANTEGRGSEYNAPNAAIFGGYWYYTSVSGSRCSLWNNAASDSGGSVGSRFVADHFQAD